MKKILTIISIIAVLGFAGVAFASSLPIGGQTYYLSGAGVTSTATTIQLTYLETPDGAPITMSEIGTIGYGVLEPQTTSKIEDISFTGITQNANGSATLTGVTRGVEFYYPYAGNANLQKAHAGGAQFIISNTAQFYYNEFSMQNNSNVFTWPTASSSPATKGYVDFVGSGGANSIPATFIAQGVSQLATAAQAAAGTITGSTGFNLVLPSSIATSTGGGVTASANHVVVTGSTGLIDPSFISSTLATSTNIGYLPAYQIALQRQIFSSTGTTTFSVPSGVTLFNVQTIAGGGGGGGTGACGAVGDSSGGGGGGGGGYSNKNVNLTGTSTVQVFVGSGGPGNSDANGSNGTWSTFGTNGFYISSTGGAGGPVDNTSNIASAGGVGGIGSNGDLNIAGQGGGAPQGIVGTSISFANLASGIGGSSVMGGGANSVVGTNQTGNAGGNYGGGGSGSACYNDSNNEAGGAGAQGAVIVSW